LHFKLDKLFEKKERSNQTIWKKMSIPIQQINSCSFVKHVFDPFRSYFPKAVSYIEEENSAIIQSLYPPTEQREEPQLTISYKGHVYTSAATFIGPCHLLTSGAYIYYPEDKTWAEEIAVSQENVNISEPCKVAKAYIFSEWADQKDSRYNIALLILSHSLGKQTGWKAVASVPEIEHNVFDSAQLGKAYTTRYLGAQVVTAIESGDEGSDSQIVPLLIPQIRALARKISNNYRRSPPMAFGKGYWNHYFGDIGKEPPLPENINEILQTASPLNPQKKVYQTHLLTLIPASVNGVPLTLKTLQELVKDKAKYDIFEIGLYEDEPVLFSHWTLLTQDIIPESRNRAYSRHEKLIQKYPGYEIPNVLDTTVAIIMAFVQDGTRFYSTNPRTCTRCQETSSKSTHLIVGNFSKSGLHVSNYPLENHIIGVGLQRKLI
jgi:hypothetical protein